MENQGKHRKTKREQREIKEAQRKPKETQGKQRKPKEDQGKLEETKENQENKRKPKEKQGNQRKKQMYFIHCDARQGNKTTLWSTSLLPSYLRGHWTTVITNLEAA